MKKKYIAPTLQRIELNLEENIASSATEVNGYIPPFITRQYGVAGESCFALVQQTLYTPDKANAAPFLEIWMSGCLMT